MSACAWTFAECACAGSMDDDNRKLEWTLKAIAMNDPFEQKQDADSDIKDCLTCAAHCNFAWDGCWRVSVLQMAARQICGGHYSPKGYDDEQNCYVGRAAPGFRPMRKMV